MDLAIFGGFIRFVQGLASAAPTLIVGLFIAALLRYYLGVKGTQKLFGGDSLRSLPQSWLIGMLLPVCSIGVIPIIREMRRMGLRPGVITAFALSAPLFNPLSLLYGLTLSRPYVIIGFALGSLLVVTLLGIAWDKLAGDSRREVEDKPGPIGLSRLMLCFGYMGRELLGATGGLTLIALAGLFFLGAILPHGALQSSVEQLDPLAPLKMSVVAVPIYATPMLTMSQLGMMFAHGNSPGAAFCLLLLGTGINLGTLWWIANNYGLRSTVIWFSVLFVIVLGCAYAVDRPLIPPGIEPAGHTHAFDIYTNPLHDGGSVSIATIKDRLSDSVTFFDWLALSMLGVVGVGGLVVRFVLADWLARLESTPADLEKLSSEAKFDRVVSPRTVGLTCMAGLVAFSVVACYAYYPPPREVLEEMRLARVELLSGVSSRDHKRVLHWIPVLEEWSRRLEVGYALRNFELRPYQQMQAHLLRKKLELLEHETEHAMRETDANHQAEALEELDQLRREISANANRIARAFDVRGRL